jgi:hypothetical protein
MLACAPLAPLHGKPSALQFPAKGTSYAEARAALLKQGLVITRDPRIPDAKERAAIRKDGWVVAKELAPLDRRFHELRCWKHIKYTDCHALFLETSEDGWRTYVIVDVDPKDETVIDASYPAPAEGLPAISPPLPRDVPQIKGSYLKARATLRALGFRPGRGHQPDDLAGAVCLDEHCKREGRLPEAQCSGSGQSYCNAYWISPGGRVLLVGTIGERPRVYWVVWSTWKALHADLD